MTREKLPRGRSLDRADRELWARFTRTITPLRAAAVPITADEDAAAAPGVREMPRGPERPPSAENAAPPLTSLDRRLRQRLARGRIGLDARLDLHGLTQAQAHDALVRFLRASRAEGARIVLVITGKGTRSAEEEGGVLRRQVPLWLRSPQLRETVLGFEPAGPAHGGEGAFYVRLRRARS